MLDVHAWSKRPVDRTRAITRLVLVMMVILLAGGLLVAAAARTTPRVGPPSSAKDAAVWYNQHRDELVAVAQLARSGALGDPSSWDYYGPRLPERYAYLSDNGRIAAILGPEGEPPVLFLPAVMGIPDDAIGLAHFASPPTWGAAYDGFGHTIRPSQPLGDGWWWLE